MAKTESIGDNSSIFFDDCFTSTSNGGASISDSMSTLSLNLYDEDVPEMFWDWEPNLEPILSRRSVVNVVKQHSDKNYTFTKDQTRDIDRTNANLMQRIIKAKSSPATISKDLPKTTDMVASAAINRKKKQREIDRTNELLRNKLQAISNKKSKK